MSADDRTAAWAALHDPATDSGVLAGIAAVHPEFAAAIAQHPNAYPQLVAWARGPASESNNVATAAAMPGTAQPGRGHGVLWRVALSVVVVVPLGISLFWAFVYSGVIELSDYLYYYGSWIFFILGAVPALVVCAVAAIAAPSVSRKVGSMFLAVGAAAFMALVESGGGGSTAAAVAVLLADVCLFLAWAVARPLRGVGYTAIVVVVIADVGGYLFESLTNNRGLLAATIAIAVVRYAVIPIGIVALARAWSGISERRLAASAPRQAAAPRQSAAGYVRAPTSQTNTMAVLSLVFALFLTPQPTG